jgi:holo-[acyl-carrier protein] synthase
VKIIAFFYFFRYLFWMIYGIGIDIIKIERFERALTRWEDRLLERVFTPQERATCHNKAFLKALGIGMFQGVAWNDIEILNDPLGRPLMNVKGEAKKICQEKGITEIFVSISHETGYGVAHVLLEM